MEIRPIDANAMLNELRPLGLEAEHSAMLLSDVSKMMREWVDRQPTLTPPNEPMLERVVREYLEICGNDCAGDPSVGIPECPFYQYADVLDNGALIQPKCELAAYRRPPEGEV